MKRKKAQVWSLDLVISVVIFLLVFIPLLVIWNYTNMQSNQQVLFDDAERLALSVSDSLIRTEGMPENWTQANVISLGIASEENVLNATKVSDFFGLAASDYNRTRAILTGGYDFFFNLTDINGTSYGAIGSKDVERMVVPVERYCIYNERIVKMELALLI